MILTALLYTIHVLVCIFLILVVLLQQGKGADLSVFGGGSTQTAFGARGATTLLHKLTVGSFIVFTLTTLAIGIRQAGPGAASVMSRVVQEDTAQPAPAAPANPAPATPGQQAPAQQPAQGGNGGSQQR
ncbi:MAG TPA: preprotein translocase subunit SecG [Thermoanaerobaculia bacterium]|nr:preprotein translocase subunit SecG [Thermoanaerobaculia bacterium]